MKSNAYPRESQLLLACGRRTLGTTAELHLKQILDAPIDWPKAISLAQRHGLLPLLYWHLHRSCVEQTPTDVLENLKRHFFSNLQRNQNLTRELLRLVQLFEQQNILFVSYKGPVLAQHIYQNVGFREFADLDVLIKKEDADHIRGLLLKEGYEPAYKLTRAQEAAYWKANGEFIFFQSQKGIYLEVHHRLLPARFRFPVEMNAVLNNLESYALDGVSIRSLSKENQILFLSVHNSKHLWEKMLWICDIAELLRIHSSEIDWGQFWERAKQLRSVRKVLLGMYLASTLLDAPISEQTATLLRTEPAVKWTGERITERLFAQEENSSRVPKLKLNIKIADRPIDAWRFVYHRALTPTIEDWSAVSLPDLLYPLYYVVRLGRSAMKYIVDPAVSRVRFGLASHK